MEAAEYALEEFRRLIYTTGTMEGFHRILRTYTKDKTIFPTGGAVRKPVYPSIQEIAKKRMQPGCDRGVIISSFYKKVLRRSTFL